jgi:integrase
MANISKRSSGSYRVQIRRQGCTAISKTFKSRSAATQWARKTESELERGLYVDFSQAQKVKFSTVLKRYSNEIAPLQKGFKQEVSRCRIVGSRLGNQFLSTVTPSILSQYREDRLQEVSPKTVREELLLVQRVINVCMKDWGIALPENVNPVSLVRKPKIDNARSRRLTPQEYIELSASPLFSFAIETGMRRGEIASMKWMDLDEELRILNIPITKNGKTRTIPLSQLAQSILKIKKDTSHANDELVWGVSADTITHRFIRFCKRYGYVDLRFHDLRHEATSRFFERGLNTIEVASITGHSDLRMLQRYTHISPNHLVKRLDKQIHGT